MEDEEDYTWLKTQFKIESETNLNIYLQLLTDNVKTAVGLGTYSLDSPVEIGMQMVWMFIGLSMYG